MSALHLDFETRSACDLKRAGLHIYAEHPTTEILCAAYSFDDGPVRLWKRGEPIPREVFEHIVLDNEVWAHNAAFEREIMNAAGLKQGWPTLTAEQCVCTMAMAYAMAVPASLEKAAAALGIAQQKDMSGSRVMMQLAQPRREEADGTIVWWEENENPEKFERLYAYCKQDVEVERELGRRLMRLSPYEQQVWVLDQRINSRGVAIDVKAVRSAIKLVDLEKKRLDREMRRVTKNAVATCSATAQLTAWLKDRGLVEIDGVAKADVTALLSAEIPDDVRTALLLRQEAAKSSTAKLSMMIDGVGFDDRIRGIFQYHGAATGRWAGRRLQPQNFPRPKIAQDEIESILDLLGSVE